MRMRGRCAVTVARCHAVPAHINSFASFKMNSASHSPASCGTSSAAGGSGAEDGGSESDLLPAAQSCLLFSSSDGRTSLQSKPGACSTAVAALWPKPAASVTLVVNAEAQLSMQALAVHRAARRQRFLNSVGAIGRAGRTERRQRGQRYTLARQLCAARLHALPHIAAIHAWRRRRQHLHDVPHR